MSDRADPYKVLGVDPSAEPEVIASAHRALARSHHPDVSRDPHAEARMAEINAAWTILRDPERRATYDREHGIVEGRRPGNPDNPLRALTKQPTGASPASGSPAARPGAAQPTGRPGQVVWRRGPEGVGAAGPPPGRPAGSVLPFGRHIGWSIGEIARVDPGYLQWLGARAEGRPYKAEIDRIIAPLLRTADGRGFIRPQDSQGPAKDDRRR